MREPRGRSAIALKETWAERHGEQNEEACHVCLKRIKGTVGRHIPRTRLKMFRTSRNEKHETQDILSKIKEFTPAT